MAADAERLSPYRHKRDFTVTSEPAGGEEAGGPESNRFVIQQHAARRMHYDFRLEAGGVLLSWAVPKGPSYDPKAKRLAVHVEDHPVEYRSFEGIIPSHQYGSGAVIVWDEGTYTNLTERGGHPITVVEAVEAGHLSIWMSGHKLEGGWSLTRTGARGDKENWILVKRQDERAGAVADVVAERPESVQSGRTVEEVGAGTDEKEWTRGIATFVAPMLASTGKDGADSSRGPLTDPPGTWLFEAKFDGLRCVAVRNGDDVQLWSRNRLSFTKRFPGIVRALAELAPDNFTIDGEIVAEVDGRSSFAELQGGGSAQPYLAAFDLLHLLGHDVRPLPIEERKQLLARAVSPGPALRLVEPLDGDPQALVEDAARRGWEGLVAKRAGSAYSGGRSPLWRKLKLSGRQELVVGGFTPPEGSRRGFGALLLGYWADGELRFAGKVGTGFSEKELGRLTPMLEARTQPASPFAQAPRLRGVRWVRPELVAEVAFGDWTPDGRLRHPSYLGLRPDKDPGQVVREDVVLRSGRKPVGSD